MRFGLVHRIMTDALAALGILAVVSTATMSPWTNVALLVGLALALAVPESWQQKPAMRAFTQVATPALIVVQVARLVMGRSPLDVAVEFAAMVQIIRLATRRGAQHDQHIIVLALLHFVTGTVLGGGLAYGICFFGFLIIAPGALVLSHLRREVEGNYRQGARDRTGLPVDVPRILRSRRVVGRGFLGATCLMSVPILLFTIVLFVLFPRVGLQLLLLNHPRSDRMVGFSDHVDLGEVGELKNGNSSIALRFDVSDLPDPPPAKFLLRMRGTAFDTYDGRAWLRTMNDRRAADRAPGDTYLVHRPPRVGDQKVSIDLEPLDPPVIFLPPRAVAIQTRTPMQPMGDPLGIQKGPEGEFRYSGSDVRGLRYDVVQAPINENFPESLTNVDRARYLTVPAALPARVGLLAHEWADPFATDVEKAHAIETHLRTELHYDMSAPSSGTAQPVDNFLFETKRGHCEFFSTAMAVMLREVGIPSRNVVGFVGGTYNHFGRYYAVREQDSHSWVEAYIEERRGMGGSWQTFDPTPAAGIEPLAPTTGALVYVRDLLEAVSQKWNRWVVGYDLHTQVKIFEDISHRYDRLRRSAGINHGVLDKLTRAPVVATILLGSFIGVYALWTRRRPRPKKSAQTQPLLEKRLETAAALYRALDGAMTSQGIARPVSLPPLRFAEDLAAKNHPLAPEVLALTNLYIGARFGGDELSDQTARDFERRVRELRSAKREPESLPESLRVSAT
jgi:hypothetical protein